MTNKIASTQPTRTAQVISIRSDDAPPPPSTVEKLRTENRWLASVMPSLACTSSAERLSVAAYAKRWIARRRADKLSNVDDEEAVLKNHVLDAIGNDDMRTIQRARLAALRDEWDARSALDRDDEDFAASKTCRNWWGILAKMFADAAHPDSGHVDPRDASSPPLFVREDDPAEKIKPPIERGERQQATLWPNEVATLLSCERVPLHWRVLFALAVFTGLRQSELRALLVGDVDLVNLLLSVTKKINRRSGDVEHTKTKKVGYVTIEPALAPLLQALCDGRDDTEPLLWMPAAEDLAPNVRKYLERAEVTRADLYADDDTHMQFTFHGLRHTSLTWRAGRGDSATELMGSVLHATFTQTLEYIDAAVLNALRRQKEKIFAELPSKLVVAARGGASPERTRELARSQREGLAIPTGIEPVLPT